MSVSRTSISNVSFASLQVRAALSTFSELGFYIVMWGTFILEKFIVNGTEAPL